MKNSTNLTLEIAAAVYVPIKRSLIKLVSSYYLIGMSLLALYLVQQQMGVTLELLNELQNNFDYKQISGYLFVLYLVYQWKLSRVRQGGTAIDKKSALRNHKYSGMLAPLFLFLHTTEIGTGYLGILSVVFLVTVFTGLINYENISLRHKSYLYSWLITHITAATLTSVLILFHVYVVYNYS